MITNLLIIVSLFSAPKYTVTGYFIDTESDEPTNWTGYICTDKKCKEIKTYKGKFELKLKEGKYAFRYRNKWRQEVLINFDLTTNIYDFELDVSDFQELESYPILEAFNKSRSATIEIESQGCFHHDFTRFSFNSNNGLLSTNIDGDSVNIERKLSTYEINELQDFFKKIPLVHNHGGCTTATNYQISIGTKTFVIQDGTCTENGFDKILKTPEFDVRIVITGVKLVV